jgi:hypothetical protein
MRTKVFEVPVDSIVEFAEILEENEFEGTIIGVEDTELKIRVSYEREDREVILDLMEMIDGSDNDNGDD